MFAQAPGIGIVCALLFLEEAGLPLPIAPGEAVLIGAGLLVAGRAEPIWLMAPLAYASVCCGALVGYAWANRIGPQRVRAIAVRLHAGGPYDRAATRLRAATPLQIAASRLVPGLRVYTSLVAGAVGLSLRRFLMGIMPASALWVLVYLSLGYFVGAPLERLLGRFEAYGLRAVLVVVVVAVWLLAARRVPAGERPVEPSAAEALGKGIGKGIGKGRWRVAVAVAVDLCAVFIVTGALSLVAGLVEGDPGRLPFLATLLAILGLLYLVFIRQTIGHTLGEAVLRIRYHPPRPIRSIRTG